jgi:hypothetical protein
LKKLNLYSSDKLFDKAMNLVTNEPKFSSKDMLIVLFMLPKLLARLDESMDTESTNALLEAIKDSGIEPKEFVALMEIGDIDVTRLLADVMEDSTQLIPADTLDLTPGRKKIGKDIVNTAAKEVGQRVTINHPLLTNMLVTAEGVQMPSSSKHVAAVPELMGLTAIVVAVKCDTHKYHCGGCDQRHTADVRIAFDDYNIEFYIDNDFIHAVNEDDEN